MGVPVNGTGGYQQLYFAVSNLIQADYELKALPQGSCEFIEKEAARRIAADFLNKMVEGILHETCPEG